MNIPYGSKVRVNSAAVEYVGRHFASLGEVIGSDSEGDYLVKTRVTNRGSLVGWSKPMWIKPEHLEIIK